MCKPELPELTEENLGRVTEGALVHLLQRSGCTCTKGRCYDETPTERWTHPSGASVLFFDDDRGRDRARKIAHLLGVGEIGRRTVLAELLADGKDDVQT